MSDNKITWRRSFDRERSHDFIASNNVRDIGRIYKNHRQDWQWFAWLKDGSGESGLCEKRQDAIEAIQSRA